MASSVTNKEAILLADDETEVVLRPLVISRLRRVYEAWEEIEKVGATDDEGNDTSGGVEEFDVLLNCVGICLEKDLAEKVEGQLYASKSKVQVGKAYKELLEELMDMELIERVLKVCASIDLKAMREASRAVAMAQLGQTST